MIVNDQQPEIADENGNILISLKLHVVMYYRQNSNSDSKSGVYDHSVGK